MTLSVAEAVDLMQRYDEAQMVYKSALKEFGVNSDETITSAGVIRNLRSLILDAMTGQRNFQL